MYEVYFENKSVERSNRLLLTLLNIQHTYIKSF